MKLRKIFAGIVASAIAATMVTASFAATPDAMQAGEAMIGFGDVDWKVQSWGVSGDTVLPMSHFTNATITGNGEYTVSVDLSSGFTGYGSGGDAMVDEETGDPVVFTQATGIGAMAVLVNLPSDDEANANLIIDITSIKFDGVESMLDGVTSYTNMEDGIFRSNVCNQWSAPKDTDKSTDMSTASAVLTDFADFWSKCEITFTISGYPEAAETPETEAPETDAPANPDTNKPNTNTGVEGVALVAGVAVLATGAVVVSKKRK